MTDTRPDALATTAGAATPEPDQAPALSRGKKLLFSLVLLLIVALVLEGASQWYLRSYKGYAGGEFLQYEFDPYKNISLQRNWVDTRGVRHNAQGFRRDSAVVRAKPEGTYRVFLMGASTAYGLGGLWPHLQSEYEVLDNSETIDAYLERILADSLPYERVEVINAGVPSIWTHHHLINLNQRILGYDPDFILFLDGWNDHFFFDRTHDQFASYVHGEQSQVIMGPPTFNALVRANGWWFFRKSAFVQVVGRAARNIKPLLVRRDPPPPINVAKAVEDVQWVFDRNARKMIERNAMILQREGIPTIFMLQPILALERSHLGRMGEMERTLFDFNIAAWAPGYEDFMTQATPLIAKRISETVTPLGAGFMDLTGIYEAPTGQIFTDYAHLTPEGNRILAERVANEMLKRIRAGAGAAASKGATARAPSRR